MARSQPAPRKRSRPAPPLWSLSVLVHPEAEDALAELLLRLTGAPAIITHSRITGLSTGAVFLSDGKFFTPARRSELRAGLRNLTACGLNVGPARLRWQRVPPEDWRESWKKHFPPLLIGRQLVVRPSWAKVPKVPGRRELVLDPGLSFGTGQHPTTEFCLREIVRLRPREGAEVPGLLDVGTGSGILALAAARLGYAPVEAFDFDPDCVEVARENTRRNRLDPAVAWSQRDVATLRTRPPRRFAVVCANLTADLLLRHAERLVAQLAPGGTLILAGILAEEFASVAARFTGLGLQPARSIHRREWRSGSFVLTRPDR